MVRSHRYVRVLMCCVRCRARSLCLSFLPYPPPPLLPSLSPYPTTFPTAFVDIESVGGYFRHGAIFEVYPFPYLPSTSRWNMWIASEAARRSRLTWHSPSWSLSLPMSLIRPIFLLCRPKISPFLAKNHQASQPLAHCGGRGITGSPRP